MMVATPFAIVASVCLVSCAPSAGPTSGRHASAPSTSATFPSTRSETFVATPVEPSDLSPTEALSIAKRANAELKLPANTVSVHGVLTNMTNDRTPVWAYRFHSCEVPHAAIKTNNPLCTRWVFLQSQDGSFVEATYTA
jgi:hypothetical protein